jgi:peptide deformylase
MAEAVRILNDPILRRKCDPVDTANLSADPKVVQSLLDEMFATMTAEKGIGLAANQVGYTVQIFILKDGDSFKEFINPEIVSQSELVDFEGEGCLSIPGTSGKTKRYKQLTLTWLDRNGTKNESVFQDMQAFAVQHEMDHLNGKLYIDQFGPVKRDLVLSKHRKHMRSK